MALVQDARNMLRDFPQFFEATFDNGPTVSTLRLPAPLIASIEVIDIATNTQTSDYVLDARNGLLKMNTSTIHPEGIYVSGYHFEWFLDDDLEFYGGLVTSEHLYERPNTSFNDLSGEEQKVIAMGATYYALWSLLTQFATEIDTSTPEGMFIPAHQRFQQVQQMSQYWKAKYEENAQLLNVGLHRISQGILRRTSRLTNRLVPIFERQEIDDPRPPLRVFPRIEPQVPAPDQSINGEDIGTTEVGIGGGWNSLGTSGV